MTPYRKIILLKKIPYWIYWTVFSLIFYIISEIIFLYFNYEYFLISRIALAVLIGGLPIFYIYLGDKLLVLLEEYKNIVVAKKDFEKKIIEAKGSIFQFTPTSVFVIIVGMLLTFTTLFILGLPSKNIGFNTIIIIEFVIFQIPAFQGIYIFISLIIFFRKLQKIDIEIPFFNLPNKTINKLENYWWIMTIGVTLFYFITGLFIYVGPYGLRLELVIWLTLVGLIPFSLFTWSVFQTHLIIKKIKYDHKESINFLIQKCLNLTKKNINNENIDNLHKLIEIQKQVIQIKEWNISFERFLLFLITLFTAISQMILFLDKLEI